MGLEEAIESESLADELAGLAEDVNKNKLDILREYVKRRLYTRAKSGGRTFEIANQLHVSIDGDKWSTIFCSNTDVSIIADELEKQGLKVSRGLAYFTISW